ncbi:MAG: hypothetical protein U9N14_05025 [Pseudomonadota bacterium]|nr:hypothetical protein [Pseudomonadota bacterium]
MLKLFRANANTIVKRNPDSTAPFAYEKDVLDVLTKANRPEKTGIDNVADAYSAERRALDKRLAHTPCGRALIRARGRNGCLVNFEINKNRGGCFINRSIDGATRIMIDVEGNDPNRLINVLVHEHFHCLQALLSPRILNMYLMPELVPRDCFMLSSMIEIGAEFGVAVEMSKRRETDPEAYAYYRRKQPKLLDAAARLTGRDGRLVTKPGREAKIAAIRAFADYFHQRENLTKNVTKAYKNRPTTPQVSMAAVDLARLAHMMDIPFWGNLFEEAPDVMAMMVEGFRSGAIYNNVERKALDKAESIACVFLAITTKKNQTLDFKP